MGEPRLLGVDAEFFTRVHLECLIGIGHQRRHHLLRRFRFHAARLVERDKFGPLLGGPHRELMALDAQLALGQLHLCADRQVLTHRHRTRASDETRQPGEAHHRSRWIAPAATPRMSDTLETRPSLTPKMAARAEPPLISR